MYTDVYELISIEGVNRSNWNVFNNENITNFYPKTHKKSNCVSVYPHKIAFTQPFYLKQYFTIESTSCKTSDVNLFHNRGQAVEKTQDHLHLVYVIA